MQCTENRLHSWYQDVVLNLQTLRHYCDVCICKLCACTHTHTYIDTHTQRICIRVSWNLESQNILLLGSLNDTSTALCSMSLG